MNTLTVAAAFVLWIGTSPNGFEWEWDPNQTFTSLSDCTTKKQHEIDAWVSVANLSDKNISEGLQSSNEKTRVVDDTVYTYQIGTKNPIVYRYRCLPDTIDPRDPQERKK